MANFRNYHTCDAVLPEQEKRNRTGDRINPQRSAVIIQCRCPFSIIELVLHREASQSEYDNTELGLLPVLEPQSPISLYIQYKVRKLVIQDSDSER